MLGATKGCKNALSIINEVEHNNNSNDDNSTDNNIWLRGKTFKISDNNGSIAQILKLL